MTPCSRRDNVEVVKRILNYLTSWTSRVRVELGWPLVFYSLSSTQNQLYAISLLNQIRLQVLQMRLMSNAVSQTLSTTIHAGTVA